MESIDHNQGLYAVTQKVWLTFNLPSVIMNLIK